MSAGVEPNVLNVAGATGKEFGIVLDIGVFIKETGGTGRGLGVVVELRSTAVLWEHCGKSGSDLNDNEARTIGVRTRFRCVFLGEGCSLSVVNSVVVLGLSVGLSKRRTIVVIARCLFRPALQPR